MVKKKVDSRIRDLIENGVKLKERTMFIVIGDRARLQLPNLHLLLNNAAENKINKKILWAYRKDLGFDTHRGKREKKMKREVKQGKREANSADPFELFLTTQNIRYVYYKESEQVLGNTYGMCVLQDFEALTPNTLARTIETVEGGGIIVLMLKTMNSLKQLYTMSMDVYSRYRTEAHHDVVGRFNERFLLSLRNLDKNSLVIDDEMNVLPALGQRKIVRLPPADDSASKDSVELRKLKESLEGDKDLEMLHSLVSLAKTHDQAKSIVQFIDSIAEKTLRNTVALTAGRGRGKSAALGIAIAAAIAHGYSNIFITSPSPENLKTLFEFIFAGLTALKYTEQHDYDIFKSNNPAYKDSVVRVNIFKSHRQTIQYIDPADSHVLGQAELVVIDEAAAIPLPLVRKLLGPYLVFMASTVNGYEGTGRSLSLKLIKQLREQSAEVDTESIRRRSLKEVKLEEPIRYAPGDKIEKWLNDLLCLNASAPVKTKTLPHPSECSLYHVNRDSLFSFHPTPELFLHKVWGLFVASHYKNSPNDLQLLSDAPAHQLFVLLGPSKPDQIPEPLCVIQVVLEGRISKQSIVSSLGAGRRGDGDLIPWAVSQQFQDTEFATLSGARVLRIATSPEFQGMGYGKRALSLLKDYYSGKIVSLSEKQPKTSEISRVSDKELSEATLATDELKPRDSSQLPALFNSLQEREPEYLDYIGVSYGLSKELHKFWRQCGFAPVYLRQTTNDLTGEHSCIMLHVLEGRQDAWLKEYTLDFHRRFLQLLAYNFKNFPTTLSLNILQGAKEAAKSVEYGEFTQTELDKLFSPFDLKRLESYGNNSLDYHVVMDMLPNLATLFFSGRIADISLNSLIQQSILLGVGLQKKSMDDLAKELQLDTRQVIAMFNKTAKKFNSEFAKVQRTAIEKGLPGIPDEELDGLDEPQKAAASSAGELNGDEESEDDSEDELKQKQKEFINSLNMDEYAFPGDWDEDAAQRAASSGGKLALKSDKSRKRKENADTVIDQELTAQKKAKKQKKQRK